MSSSNPNLASGDVVSGLEPTELVEIRRVAPFGDKTLVEGVKYDTPFVFDKTLVSVASRIRVPEHTKLLGPGHPLFDALIEWANPEMLYRQVQFLVQESDWKNVGTEV